MAGIKQEVCYYFIFLYHFEPKMKLQTAQKMHGITSFFVMQLLQRAKQLEQQGVDVIHMEIGEPDFPTPPVVLEAGKRFMQTGNIKYTAAGGLPELRTAIAEYYHEQYGVKLDSHRVIITPGASGAFLTAFGMTLNPGDTILMSDPCYPCNGNFVRLFGGEAQLINVSSDTAYQLNANLISRNWIKTSKGVLIASPSNPTGTVLPNVDLLECIHQVQNLGGFFYSDEIYHGLVYDKPFNTALAISEEVFVINSFSKFFGMTGWRVGWLVVPDVFVEAAERLAQNIFIATATHSQYAALAAFSTENMIELVRRREELKLRRDFLYENLIRLGFKIDSKPDGAFYIYADCSGICQDSFQFASELLETAGVAVTPGKDFGLNQPEKYIRFAYTVSIDRMSAALTRLEQFICR